MELIFCILNTETFSPILCILLCIRYAISLYIFNLHPAFYIFYPLFWVFYSISYILYPISYFFINLVSLYILFSKILISVSHILISISYIFFLYPISCLLYPVSFTLYPALGILYLWRRLLVRILVRSPIESSVLATRGTYVSSFCCLCVMFYYP